VLLIVSVLLFVATGLLYVFLIYRSAKPAPVRNEATSSCDPWSNGIWLESERSLRALAEVNELLAALERGQRGLWGFGLAGDIAGAIGGGGRPVSRLKEKRWLTGMKIVELFRGFDRQCLNFVLTSVDFEHLLLAMHDESMSSGSAREVLEAVGNGAAGQKANNRTAFLGLVMERVQELGMLARARILDALVLVGMRAYHPDAEAWCEKLFVTVDSLNHLNLIKSFIEEGCDFNTVPKLLYDDIADVKVRTSILLHFRRIWQASIQVSLDRRPLKIVSDIDDTFACSGGDLTFKGRIAGCDNTYPPKVIYPGVLAFHKELDGPNADGSWPRGRIGNVVFCTARPHIWKDLSESHMYKRFRALVDKGQMHASPSILAGGLMSSAPALVGKYGLVAKKKFDSIKSYMEIYPDHGLVFLGDDGQGDVETGSFLLADPLTGPVCRAVFIHLVNQEVAAEAAKTKGGQKAKVASEASIGASLRSPHLGPAPALPVSAVASVTGAPSAAAAAPVPASGQAQPAAPAQVAGSSSSPVLPSPAAYSLKSDPRLIFFNDYVHAAILAYHARLLRIQAVRRIAMAASHDIAQIPFHDEAQREAAVAKLTESIKEANRLIANCGGGAPVELPYRL
jgi:hypothetical protein